MKSFTRVATCGLALLQALVTGTPLPHYFEHVPLTRRDLPVVQIQKELGHRISRGSLIFGPEHRRYASATERWSTFAVPKIQVVVQPAKESDVSKIVRTLYC